MIDSLEIRRFVVLSTTHVSEATAKMLNEKPSSQWPGLGGHYGDYGWFLYAHDENTGIGAQHIPDDLFAVMEWARRTGVDYVLLDCDGNEVPGLPVFDW